MKIEMMETDFPREIRQMARVLSFFAASRSYGHVDKLARPFSFDDVLTTVNQALRELSVIYENPAGEETIEGKRKRYIESERAGTTIRIYVPEIPSEDTITEFLKLCQKDLKNAKITAALALALAYSPSRMKIIEGDE